ncbi:MAG: YIP1 family protein [Spirochaetes bacterium]|nr:YIP1 family protein [Spirochaetota bacterium]
MDFFETAKGLLMDPTNTFNDLEDDTLENAIKYYAVIVAVFPLLFVLFIATANYSTIRVRAGVFIGDALVIFVMMLVGGLVGAFIIGVISQIGVYILGGKNGIKQTVKAVMYGLTPVLLLGWIPIIGIIAVLWSLVLEVIGIRQFQDITTGRAMIAVIFSFLIIVIIIGVIAIAFAIIMMGGGW